MANKSGAASLAPAPEPDDERDDDAVDLDKATVELSWNGFTCVVPKRRGRWPVRAVREFNRRNNIEGLIAVLGGEEQWARIEAAFPIADDFDDFVDYAVATVNRECVP